MYTKHQVLGWHIRVYIPAAWHRWPSHRLRSVVWCVNVLLLHSLSAVCLVGVRLYSTSLSSRHSSTPMDAKNLDNCCVSSLMDGCLVRVWSDHLFCGGDPCRHKEVCHRICEFVICPLFIYLCTYFSQDAAVEGFLNKHVEHKNIYTTWHCLVVQIPPCKFIRGFKGSFWEFPSLWPFWLFLVESDSKSIDFWTYCFCPFYGSVSMCCRLFFARGGDELCIIYD